MMNTLGRTPAQTDPEAIVADAFLFDMDGTLIDSIAAAERIWGRWAQRHGLDVPAFLRTIHGVRAIDTIRNLALPGIDPAEEAKRLEREEIDDRRGVVAIGGAARFLAALPENRWTVVTSAPRELAVARLGTAGLTPPATMVTAEDVPHGKPAPDCFLKGADRLGVPITRCIVFEDAPAGIQAAEASGAGLVVVGSAHRHRAIAPLLTIDSYDDVEVIATTGALRLSRR